MAHLELKGLCKGWDFPVIDRLDLNVEQGEFFVIVGPSGIGKTTLLRLIAGLERPDAGQIWIGGQDITTLPPYRRHVAMTFESYALYPHLTVFENIASPLRARKLSRSEIQTKVHTIARLLRIDTLLDRRPGEISGGQKQRTALGRTLVAEPDVFLLDEPISHLDAKIRHELRLQFHRLDELRSVATLYVTHDYTEALSLGDRIGIMGAGKLVQIGDAHDVFRKPNNLFVAQHLGQPTINVIRAQLQQRQDTLYAQTSGFEFPVAAAHAQHLNQQNAAEIEIGIRPQHLKVLGHERQTEDWPTLTAEVEIFEALGASGVLVSTIKGIALTALTAPERWFDHGQTVRLALDTGSFLYFNPQDGRNLLL